MLFIVGTVGLVFLLIGGVKFFNNKTGKSRSEYWMIIPALILGATVTAMSGVSTWINQNETLQEKTYYPVEMSKLETMEEGIAVDGNILFYKVKNENGMAIRCNADENTKPMLIRYRTYNPKSKWIKILIFEDVEKNEISYELIIPDKMMLGKITSK